LLRSPERRANVVSVLCLLLLCQPHPPATFLSVLETAVPMIRLLKLEVATADDPDGVVPTSARDALYGLAL